MSQKQTMHWGRWVAVGVIVFSLLYLVSKIRRTFKASEVVTNVENYEAFSDSEVDAFGALPIQDGGRVKPLETFANFTLMRLHGARSMEIGLDDEPFKISSVQWLMQTIFRPSTAVNFPTFVIDNTEALELIGLIQKLEEAGETVSQRDRFTYVQIAEVSEELFAKEIELRAAEKAGRDLEPTEKMLLNLAKNFRDYDGLLSSMYWVTTPVEIPAMGDMEAASVPVTEFGALAGAIAGQIERAGNDPSKIAPEVRQIATNFFEIARSADQGMNFIVPEAPADVDVEDDEAPLEPWMSAGRAMGGMINGKGLEPEWVMSELKLLLDLTAAINGEEDATEAIEAYGAHIQKGADARAEGDKIGSELLYNGANWFFWALVLFIIAFVCACIGWLAPIALAGKIARILVWVLSAVALALILIAIGHRVQIMERAPIGTLFDTIPFITGGAVFLLLFIEFFTRKGLFLGLAPIMGILGIFLTRSFEIGDGQDTLDPLQAVLDSQFWLIIHVITIVMGYSAGLLTAMISLAYIFIRVLKLDQDSPTMRRDLTRAAYGCACFTLFLTLIGTVLGGVWANDSWGRFWGWDPKENGALMITLWFLFILHARLGGYIKEWGLHIASFFSTAVIVFSWWHVNMLGVGLHAYGFSDENKMAVLKQTYWFVLAVCVVGIVFATIENMQKRKAKAAKS